MQSDIAIRLRPFTGADTEACIEIFKSNIPDYFVQKELKDFETWLKQQENPTSSDTEVQHYLVVLVENMIVGCGGFHIDLERKAARMTWGMITKRLHRHGLGKQFLLQRIRQIKAICPDSTIELDTTQHAAPFFSKIGFRTTRITPDFYALGMDRYDMIL